MPADSDDFQDIARADVPSLRRTMRKLGVIVAEVDRNLRYVWIDNPHADFDANAVVGKRDDELIGREGAELVELKQRVLDTRQPASRLLSFARSDGQRRYNISAYPIRGARGRVEGVLTVGFEAQ